MSKGSGIAVDAKGVLELFQRLSPGEMVKVHRAALSKSSRVLVKETQTKLSSVTARSSSTRSASRKGWAKGNKSGKLRDGIRMYVSRDTDYAKVHLMGDFRLKFFEMGTNPRAKRSGASTGRMGVNEFFAPAKMAARSKMAETMRRTIVEAVTKRCKQ